MIPVLFCVLSFVLLSILWLKFALWICVHVVLLHFITCHIIAWNGMLAGLLWCYKSACVVFFPHIFRSEMENTSRTNHDFSSVFTIHDLFPHFPQPLCHVLSTWGVISKMFCLIQQCRKHREDPGLVGWGHERQPFRYQRGGESIRRRADVAARKRASQSSVRLWRTRAGWAELQSRCCRR